MELNELEKYLSFFKTEEPPDALKTKVVANAKAVWTRKPPSLRAILLNYSFESYVYVLAIVLFVSFVGSKVDAVLTAKLFYDMAQSSQAKREDPEEKQMKKMFAEAGLDYKLYAMRVELIREQKKREEESKVKTPPNFVFLQKQLKEGAALVNVDYHNGL